MVPVTDMVQTSCQYQGRHRRAAINVWRCMNAGLGNAEHGRAFDFEAGQYQLFQPTSPRSITMDAIALTSNGVGSADPMQSCGTQKDYLQPSIFFSAAEIPDRE